MAGEHYFARGNLKTSRYDFGLVAVKYGHYKRVLAIGGKGGQTYPPQYIIDTEEWDDVKGEWKPFPHSLNGDFAGSMLAVSPQLVCP